MFKIFKKKQKTIEDLQNEIMKDKGVSEERRLELLVELYSNYFVVSDEYSSKNSPRFLADVKNLNSVKPFEDAAEELFKKRYFDMVSNIDEVRYSRDFNMNVVNDESIAFLEMLGFAISQGVKLPKYIQFELAVERVVANHRGQSQPE